MQDSSPESIVHVLQEAKADNWWLRQSPQVMNLPFVDGIRRADRDNAIDLYIGDDYMDVLADDAWPAIFKEKPEVFTREERENGWINCPMLHLGQMRSSHLGITLSVRIRVV